MTGNTLASNLIFTPNLFELQGKDTQITYSTSSIAGVPQFNYQTPSLNLNFSDTEIRTQDTEIGRQITVTLEQIPDQQTVTLTLLIPTINLPQQVIENSITTVAIITTERTSIGGPDLVNGQLQIYDILSLQGIARLVDF
ncbi:hypothetical protein I8748_33415 [Nostoc sp. CENA67]|uniref:Uncharacterized protein n=1 Tax=Amazonocrinis nigriterrae CENA67 TaxID=2794033 RepID=A0A8J7LEQ5_9NOST|nr:hypothetical protein [Amazonocrinis nigriterrae]MBH8566991.1 hypothetical protein [Amazonocrinis nigriterrae CENA67]